MTKTVYSRFEPGLTADVFHEDISGQAAALIHSSDGDFPAVITLNEWSDVETVPVPESIPENGFLVIVGDDPALATALYIETEKEAVRMGRDRSDVFGYLPIKVQSTMIPTK